MQIIIKQKYWTIGDKFKITDENGKVVFFAERQFDRFMNNVVLFDASGAPPWAYASGIEESVHKLV